MKNTLRLFSIACTLVFLSSCSATMFPKSIIVPAAQVEVKKKTDDHNNYVLELKAENMAHPERLVPPKKSYVLWAETAGAGTINLGQFTTTADDKSELVASTPYEPIELIITAEDDPRAEYPAGREITRLSLD